MAKELRQNISSSDSIVPVEGYIDRASFPENGVLQIANELIRYANTTDKEFVQCTRGYLGTTAAAHLKGVAVSLYTAIPESIETNSVLELTSPAEIAVDNVDTADIINITSVALDTLALTLPSPSAITSGRLLTVIHKTGSLGTLTVNAVSLDVAESKEFVWDGSAWTASPSAGGVTFPLLAPIGTTSIPSYSFSVDSRIGLRAQNASADGIIFTANDLDIAALIVTPSPQADEIGFDLFYGNIFIESAGTIDNPALVLGPSYIGLYESGSNQLGVSVAAAEVARFDSSSTAGDTRFMLWDVDSSSLQRVTVGAADSGGTGFKVLRIPN